jgi:hypothetical protein
MNQRNYFRLGKPVRYKTFFTELVHLFMTPLHFFTPSFWAPNTAMFVQHCANFTWK